MQKAGAHAWPPASVLPDSPLTTSPGPQGSGGSGGGWTSATRRSISMQRAPLARHSHARLRGAELRRSERDCPQRPPAGIHVAHRWERHGGLVCAFAHPGRYSSVSAFAPISPPQAAALGEKKAFSRTSPRSHSGSAWDCVARLIASAPQRLALLIAGLGRSFSGE